MRNKILLILLLFVSTVSFGQSFDQVDLEEEAIQIEKIYPNPADTYVFVNLISDKNSKATFLLYDILGNKVQQWNDQEIIPGEQRVRLNLKDHNSGIYLLRMQVEGESEVVRLRIQ